MQSFRHEFVRFIPDALEDQCLYVSIEFASAAHKCACGCGNKVVTPISPTDWRIIYDGKTVSLDPSIGNWSLPCRSHYWIRNDRVLWSEQWSDEKIEAGRANDQKEKDKFYKAQITTNDRDILAPRPRSAPQEAFLKRAPEKRKRGK